MQHVSHNGNDFTADYTAIRRGTRRIERTTVTPCIKLLVCKVEILYQMGKVFQVELSTSESGFHFKMCFFVVLNRDQFFAGFK
jgi:hypothetical protein